MKQLSKLIVLLLCAALLIPAGGCKSPATADETITIPAESGRYTEQLLDIPVPEGYQNQYIIGVSALESGVEVFTCSYLQQGDVWETHYFRHTLLEDGTVKTADEQWLNELAVDGGNELHLKRGADGTLYLFFGNYNEQGESQQCLLVSRDDGKTGTQINGDGLNALTGVNSYGLLADGSIAYTDYYNASIGLLDANGGYLDQLEGESNLVMPAVAAHGTKIATIAPEAKAIRVYDRSDGSSTDFDYDVRQQSATLLEYAPDGALYLCDSTGLYRHTQDGTLWERIMDGSTCNLGLPSFLPIGMTTAQGQPDAIYVYGEGSTLLKYWFDPAAPMAASKTISVFSLHADETVQQAIVVFNRSQSEFAASYTAAMEQGAAGTEQDYIKALNTELLAGTGPDVLILDGLPVNSYIQKGVLADIGAIVDDAEPVLSNIRAASTAGDGVLYAMPSGIRLPFAYAPGGAESAFASLSALANACENAGEVPLLASAAFNYQTLAEVLLNYYGGSLLTGNTDDIRSFLTDAGRVARSIGTDGKLCEGWEAVQGTPDEELLTAMRINNGGPQIWADMTGRAQGALLLPSGSFYSEMIVFSAAEALNAALTGIANQYEPVGLVGVNRASTSLDAAAQFVQTLLSFQVQSANKYSDAFPVNVEALNNKATNVDDTMSQSMRFDETNSLSAEWPSEAVRVQFHALAQQVNSPLMTDTVFGDMVTPVIVSYLDGSDTLETAVVKLESVISTYLSE